MLLDLLKEHAFQKREVTLASGKKSNFYIDVKRVSLTAEGAKQIGEAFFDLIQKHFPKASAAGGLTLGADPLATAVAYCSALRQQPLNAFIIRKSTKAHGLSKTIEGTDMIAPQASVVILEDVVTSGGSSLEAVGKAKAHGWQVLGVLSVVDRQEGGREKIEAEGLEFYSLYEKSDFGILE